MPIAGTIKAFFGLDPTPAVKGMNKGVKAVKTGSKQINTSLRSIKRVAATAFTGWGVAALGKDFVQAAMDMDSMRKSMSAAVGGMEKGRKEINYLRETSLQMGLSFKDSTKDFKQLAAAAKGTALEGEGIRKVWRSLQNATVALQLSTAETSGTVYAFKDMLSKGTVQAEELKRQLGNRLPGAFKMAADAMGLTTKELSRQMKMGNIMADEFLPALAKAMDDTYAGAAVEASKSMRSEMNKMNSAWFEFRSLFMETTGLSDTLAMSMRWVTKTLTGFNNGMAGLAEAMKVINGGMIMLIDMGVEGFIRIESATLSFLNTFEYLGTNVSAVGQEMWAGFKYDALIVFNYIANGFRKVSSSIKDEFADMAFVTAANLDNIGAKETSEKMFKLSDSLRKSSKKTKDAIQNETAALMAKQKAEIDSIKPAMTITQWAEKDLKISQDKEKALIRNKEVSAELHKQNIKEAEERKKTLLGRQGMPDDLGNSSAKAELSKWQLVAQDLEKSLEKLGKKSTDIAKNIQGAFTSAFKGIEDALVQMVVSGKVNWRSLADAMISDMIRVAARQAITGPLAMAMSAGMSNIGTWIGSLNQPSFTASGAGFSANPAEATAMNTFASGGMVNETVLGVGQTSGKSYSFAENESEMVLNQDQIKSLGSNKGVAVSVKPQINISTPAGTQATTQQSSDGMNIDVMITAIEAKLSSNMRRGGGLADTMQQTFGLNRSAGAFR